MAEIKLSELGHRFLFNNNISLTTVIKLCTGEEKASPATTTLFEAIQRKHGTRCIDCGDVLTETFYRCTDCNSDAGIYCYYLQLKEEFDESGDENISDTIDLIKHDAVEYLERIKSRHQRWLRDVTISYKASLAVVENNSAQTPVQTTC